MTEARLGKCRFRTLLGLLAAQLALAGSLRAEDAAADADADADAEPEFEGVAEIEAPPSEPTKHVLDEARLTSRAVHEHRIGIEGAGHAGHEMNEAAMTYGCLAVSLLVHGLAALGTSASSAAEPRLPQVSELELAPLLPDAPPPSPSPPPPPPPPPPAAPAVAPRPAPAQSRTQAASPPSSPAVPEPPSAPPEPEVTGRTSTTTADASWAAPAGNGDERGATLGVGAAAPRRSSASIAVPALPPSAPVTQPLATLSRKPTPPSLAAALERNYPSDARRQGKSGEAKVRALIDASGGATRVTVISESSAGFGSACQKTLLQSRWSPPLGPRGEATGTFVTYRCRFRIND